MKTYTVKKGDSLWAIARKLLGDGSKYKEIKKANGLTSDAIQVGMVLKIPSGRNYEEIGKAFEKALNDVDNLNSVDKLFSLIGD